MAVKERYQNPVVGDTIRLRLFSYNSNALADVDSISKIEIYFLDKTAVTEANPEGRVLLDTISSGSVVNDSAGSYYTDVTASSPTYIIGSYLDIWTLTFESAEEETYLENKFKIYPDLWYTSTIPIVYDFKFEFQPNRIRAGSKKYIIAQIIPNVPNAGTLERYYANLAIVSDLKISIEQKCGECLPNESDLRLLVDKVSVDFREKNFGYYLLDTTESGLDMDVGIYDVTFNLDFGGNTYVSDKHQLQIY